MESIEYFFSRVLGDTINRFMSRIQYTAADIAETKIRNTVEKPLGKCETSSHQDRELGD